ncbi:M50 family metallopeptidase [Candidatus Woesearchaeota archaeon]|nr:M50 family metallopeptidase [Candidatus Woesearchaeota archaeon]
MIFTSGELVDLVIMVLAIGFIFSKVFGRRPASTEYDPLVDYQKNQFFEDLKYGIILAAPAVVLHEFAHKFVAMSFGAQAFLQAPIMWYAIAILLILFNAPIIFFVGGQVSVVGNLTPFNYALVALAGPFTNLVLWIIISKWVVKQKFAQKNLQLWTMMGKLNMFLFVFNMIPLPGFDGWNFVVGLFQTIF